MRTVANFYGAYTFTLLLERPKVPNSASCPASCAYESFWILRTLPAALARSSKGVSVDGSRFRTLDKQLAEKLIEPCRSPYSALPILIRKADWSPDNPSYRCVLDYRALNLATVKDTYPLPNSDRNLVALGKSNLFTTCDLLQGFHQVELSDDAKIKTAFTTPWGQFAYTRMPMGLTSSPGTFMRLVDATLRGLPPGIALAFVDDIIIPTEGLRLFVAMREVKYLGFLVGAYGTRPDPKKTQALMDITVEQMKYDPAAAGRFAGAMGYYHKFIPHLHTLLAPFHALKQKSADAVKIMGSLAFKAAFVELKRRLASVTSLRRPDFSKPFYIDVDSATSGGVGAVPTHAK
ncbi:hypothetical protein AB1Y20_012936 [Prymnesium parvum]|uniref:Reverse transcriptase domain-containing protein n=1 Tax=Prymnesium parvum TaxID=97485 RepID=A0AB34IJ91_PRYPA